MRRATLSILFACPFFLAACGALEPKVSAGPRMVVSEDHTIFYRHMLLRKGVVVKVLKKEFLYSLVELSNGQKGYVANDSLVQAPKIPEKPNGMVAAKPARKIAKAKNKGKKTSSLTPSGSNPSDALPLPSFRY